MIKNTTRACAAIAVLAMACHVPQPAQAQLECEATEFQRLELPPPRPQFEYGQVVAIDGDVAMVGLPNAEGAVQAYRRIGVRWAEETLLRYPGNDQGTEFGSSVGVSGDTAVIGARRDSVNGTRAGSAFVYRFDGGSWELAARLLAPDPQRDDLFGWSAAVHGDWIVIGAVQRDPEAAGKAYVFRFDGDDWLLHSTLVASDGKARDEFGYSIALHGDTLAVGAWNHGHSDRRDVPDGFGAAYVYRFDRDGDRWVEEIKLQSTRPRPDDRDRFGRAMDMDESLLLIGTDPISFGQSSPGGSAYIFRYDGHDWRDEAKLESSDLQGGDRFGAAVGINGDIAVVGAWGEWPFHCPFPLICHAGAAYVFRRDGVLWVEEAKVTSSQVEENDAFGASVGVDGDDAIVGTWRDDGVYLFAGLSDCNGNDGLDMCDIERGISRDDDDDGRPDECACAGRERIAKVSCRDGRRDRKLVIVLKRGRSMDGYEVELSTGQLAVGRLNNRGKSRVRIRGLDGGDGRVAVRWECGARAETGYECP